VREVLRIGGVAVAIDCTDERLVSRLAAPLSAFLAAEPCAIDFTLTARVLETYEPPRGECLFDSGEVWSLHRDGQAFRIECRSPLFGETPYKVAVIDEGFTHAEVLMRTGTAQAHPIEFPIDELLFNALLARRGAIEVHACGVIDGSDGYLFIGNSGDGKTTTAGLWMSLGGEIVSDDRVVLRKHDGAWWMYGTPWHGEAEICSPSRAPLRRIFALDKATANGMAPLSAAQGAARILACAFPPFHDTEGMKNAIGIAAALASEVPVTRFSFANDPSAVAFVRALPTERAA
jgi:hypothetical protein